MEKNLSISSAKAKSFSRSSGHPLENLSIATKMVVELCEFKRSVTESIVICDQGQLGISKGSKRPQGQLVAHLSIGKRLLPTLASGASTFTADKTVGSGCFSIGVFVNLVFSSLKAWSAVLLQSTLGDTSFWSATRDVA